MKMSVITKKRHMEYQHSTLRWKVWFTGWYEGEMKGLQQIGWCTEEMTSQRTHVVMKEWVAYN